MITRKNLKTVGINGRCCPEEPVLCGKWPFVTNKDDPFFSACVWHDSAYEGLEAYESTKWIDRIFLEKMLFIAGEDKPLRIRARLYYSLARTYGICRFGYRSIFIWPWAKK